MTSLDLRQNAKATELPSNIEAEQAVIGAVLYDNLAMEKCEAITHEESEHIESGHIIGEVQRGYKQGERVLRPAMVRVAK